MKFKKILSGDNLRTLSYKITIPYLLTNSGKSLFHVPVCVLVYSHDEQDISEL